MTFSATSRRCRRLFSFRGAFATTAAAVLIAGAFTLSRVFAVDVCHDNTQNHYTGEDSKMVGVDDLRKAFKKGRFDKIDVTGKPYDEVQGMLRPDDGIIIGDDHSGFVNADGKIENYIQQRTEPNPANLETEIIPIDPADLKNQDTYRINSYEEIREYDRNNNLTGVGRWPYRDPKKRVTIHRPPADFSPEDIERMKKVLRKPIEEARKQKEALDADVGDDSGSGDGQSGNTARDVANNAAKTAIRGGMNRQPTSTRPPWCPPMGHRIR